MRAPPDEPDPGRVYWLESSKRRQALEWLRRDDLTAEERRILGHFVEDYRTSPALGAAERRRLLEAYDRLARRFSGVGPESRPR